MKLKVYTEGSKKEKVGFLKLVEHYSYIELIMVDKTGIKIPDGRILDIDPERGIILATTPSRECGLPLDQQGYVKVYHPCRGSYIK